MATYTVQVRVNYPSDQSVGYAAFESPPFDSGSGTTPRYNAWRPWYTFDGSSGTFRPTDRRPVGEVVRPFIKWVFNVGLSNVDASMLDYVMPVEAAGQSPTFFETGSETVTFRNLDREFSGLNGQQPVITVTATAYFATGDPAVDPPPAGLKVVTVTVVNGTPVDSVTHEAAGTVTVNSNSSTTQASDSGYAAKDGSSGFSYSISATPSDGYVFDHWSDGDTNASRSGVAYSDKTFTAYFKRVYSVKVFEYSFGGAVQDVCINASYLSGTGTYDSGDTVTVSFTPSQGATPVAFRAAKVVGMSEGAPTTELLWTADGLTTKTFTMPSADVFVVVGCFYDEISVIPVLYTDLAVDSTGGSVSPARYSNKENGQTVSFTATAATGYVIGSAESGGFVWYWGADIFDMGGASRAQSGASSSATLVGDASSQLTGLPSWTGLNGLSAAWFMNGSYSSPDVYFRTEVPAGKFKVKLRVVTYSGHAEWYPVSEFLYRVEDNLTVYARIKRGDYPSYSIVGAVKEVQGSRTVLLINGSLQNYEYSVPQADRISGSVFIIDLFAWPVTTGKILYSPSNSGKILRGSGGSPMAQFVDT